MEINTFLECGILDDIIRRNIKEYRKTRKNISFENDDEAVRHFKNYEKKAIIATYNSIINHPDKYKIPDSLCSVGIHKLQLDLMRQEGLFQKVKGMTMADRSKQVSAWINENRVAVRVVYCWFHSQVNECTNHYDHSHDLERICEFIPLSYITSPFFHMDKK